LIYRVLIRPRALLDLRRLHDFLVAKSPRAALRAVEAIEQGIASLDQFPLRTPRLGSPETHELVVRFGRDGYVVRYRVRGDEVVITRIFHGRERR